MPQAAEAIASWWAELAPTTQATIGSVAASTAGTAAQIAFQPKPPHIAIPPPPGAALISQSGSEANAAERRRLAAAGGLASTLTAAGGSATGQSKTLLGQ